MFANNEMMEFMERQSYKLKVAAFSTLVFNSETRKRQRHERRTYEMFRKSWCFEKLLKYAKWKRRVKYLMG
jgi:hypothetical protein